MVQKIALETVLKLLWKWFKKILLKLLWNCSKAALKMVQKIALETALKLL